MRQTWENSIKRHKVIYMRLKRFTIKNFRSIENIIIDFPLNKPVALFGPNNAGKSNIFRALEYFLGERYTPNIEFLDSDYYLRDKERYPHITFEAEFDGNYYSGSRYKSPLNKISFIHRLLFHSFATPETKTMLDL
ncbi:MAG: AAA family ATPase [Firmicutes bacterium]|nr:AAA family ATPase [Bacillota bacterium]